MSDLKTIDDLMEDRFPGEIKIRNVNWDNDDYFIPYFITTCGLWYGIDVDGAATYYADTASWQIYTEPKRKKIVYEWMFYSHRGWFISDALCTEEEATHTYRGVYQKTGRQFEVEEND
jgi:hypothetical protein